MQKLIECVPNFSEGRDQNVIRQITDAIESVDGVSLLDVDPGASTNRTVVTLVGDPDATVEAAFRAIRKATELIDMRKQTGAHPRMGATDVCPFIPVSNVSWEEAIECARKLGKRVGEELKIPVYLYEKAASDPERSNLSIIRAGEYEGFFDKIKQPQWKPDFGPAVFNENSGPKIRFPLRLLDLIEEAFVFTGADDRQVRALRIARRFLVKINRNLQFLPDPLPQLPRALDRFLPAHVAHRDKRANVGRAHSRMRARLLPHVDELGCLLDSAKCRFDRRVRSSRKRHHRPIRARTWIDIQ